MVFFSAYINENGIISYFSLNYAVEIIKTNVIWVISPKGGPGKQKIMPEEDSNGFIETQSKNFGKKYVSTQIPG